MPNEAVTQIFDLGVERRREAIASLLGNHNLARTGKAHEPLGKIDSPAQDVVELYDNVADLQTHTQIDPAISRDTNVAASAFRLNRQRGGDG